MSNYSAVSTISWLDVDDDETRRVREAIAALDDKETLDPIGIGTIRDAFSEALFPGTSTIQTRLRYFLFVPWICQAVAAKRPDRRAFQDRLREQEMRLLDSLRHIGANQGVIGYRAGKKLSRLPSSVYWYGLGAWGVRAQARLTLAEYRDLVARRGRPDRVIRDDEGGVLGGADPVWDPGLPEAPEGFRATELTMAVTADEAHYLRDRMAGTRLASAGHAASPSMLACLAGDPAAWCQVEDPWSGPVDTLPQPVADILRHARHFSSVTYGAQLLYNTLLADKAGKDLGIDTSDLADWLDDQVESWVHSVAADVAGLQAWWSRPELFWTTVSDCGGRVRPATRTFLQRWITAAVKDPAAVMANAGLRQQVREQELALKGRYARLSYQPALQSWEGEPIGGTPLYYRWRNMRQLLNDLHDGLAREVADAAA